MCGCDRSRRALLDPRRIRAGNDWRAQRFRGGGGVPSVDSEAGLGLASEDGLGLAASRSTQRPT